MSGRHRRADSHADQTGPRDERTGQQPQVNLADRPAAQPAQDERVGRRRRALAEPAADGATPPAPPASQPPGTPAGTEQRVGTEPRVGTGERVGRRRRPDVEGAPAPEPAAPPAAPTAAPAGSAAALPARTVTTGARRAQQMEEQRRRSQLFRVALIGGLVLVLLAGGLAAWRLVASGSGKHPETAAPRQHTLLLQLAGPDKRALDSALVAVTDAKSDAAVVLVPSHLVTDVPGAGSMPFGDVLTMPDPAASRNALTDLTGVNVQASYVLRPNGLKALVDRLGGVDVDVDTDVVTRTANGATTVLVPSGQQHLSGALAYAFASYSASASEPDQARLARFSEVLRAVLDKLPRSPNQVASVLNGLDAVSSLPMDTTAQLLATLGRVDEAGSVTYDTLPVRDIDTGSSTIAYGIDAAGAETLVRSRFAGSLLGEGSRPVKVLVENGVGTPGLVDQARTKLVSAGFRFVNGGNATQFGFAQTVVLIPDASDANRAKGEKVAKALGVPLQDVQTSTRGQNVADVIVILGKDFKP